ncbi:ParB/RepB/Spo0J family partition protein [Streptacidiphilus sp. BW17]|uniref:ParB/RepB/Spo0J family partition protein n=1 Tax=unclassified Streptacidiphilus TaxID=2643834 RepID=UPI00351351E4
MTTVLAPIGLLNDEADSPELAAAEVELTADAADPAPVAAKVLLEDVDPSELIFTRNVRKAELTPDFVGSIKENGLYQPIIATPHEDGIAIILGNRRAKGSIEAGRTVDVIVRNDLTAEEARIIAQLAENMHREDMRQSEIADAYAQLSIELGLDADQIATRVAQDPKKVRASIALAAMPKTARVAVDKGALTLEDATLLSEFEGDPKAYKRLLGTIEKAGSLTWAIKDERRKAARAVLRQETTQALKAAGVRMVGEPYGFSWKSSKEVGLDRLADGDGVVLSPENHKDCPGNAAFFNEHQDGDLKATFLCRDPHQYGHQVPASYSFLSPAEEAAKAAAEQGARERREALAIAEEVRHEYIQELCRSKKVPKGMTRKLIAMLFTLGADEASPEALSLLKAPGDDDPRARYGRFVGRMAEARLPLALLATVAVRAERAVRQAASGYGDKWAAIEWFEFLMAYGYELHEPEVELLAGLRAKIAEAEARAAAKAAAEAEEDEDRDEEDAPELAADDDQEDEADSQSRHLEIVMDDEPDDLDSEDAGEAEEIDWEARFPEINELIAA